MTSDPLSIADSTPPRFSIAFVTPRYGIEVVGGAETAARTIAELLAGRGHSIHAYSSTAKDSDTWDNYYTPGEAQINGVRVQRFQVTKGRDEHFASFARRILFAPRAATIAETERFIELQGPIVPGLIEALGAAEHDAVVFYPYLFFPTVAGVPVTKSPIILHPAAHDEAPLYLSIFQEIFAQATGLVYHTYAEKKLVHDNFCVSSQRELILGLGIDIPARNHEVEAKIQSRIGESPYLLCLGRVDGHKGTTMLSNFFATYKSRIHSNLRLVFAGPIVVHPGEHPDMEFLGEVTEEEKWALLQGATALVQPSYFEAFSLVLFEAWSLGRPVIVNEGCEATFEHVMRSGGGLSFASYPEFEVAIDLAHNDGATMSRLGEAGERYSTSFQWPALIDRYEKWLTEVIRYWRPCEAGEPREEAHP